MVAPLQALCLAPDLLIDTIEGRKPISIRLGHRDYHPGPVVLCSPELGICVEAEITSVVHSSMLKVHQQDLWDAGYKDIIHAHLGLKRFYPLIRMEDEVTVIRWKNVHGKMRDKFLAGKV